MDNVNNFDLVREINSLLNKGMSLNDVAKQLKTNKKDLLKVMKNRDYIFDKSEGCFIQEKPIIQRIEKLEQQQREILELLSNTKRKNELKIDNDILNGEIIQKSYKLNKEIAERFSDYCKELRGSGIKSQDILSMALLEFLQKRNR
ncbi:hypothetical protein QTI92_12940 [Clostridium perfringens]|uniref:hypothetical protein n=1 Tax=Clostridium perfringens TaxID=1502 RepID=UPI00232FE38B|nr:hypothetical protein [Clostridium perfringens]MDB2047361.1 hypothetical protein [Clostridium perfringens]MDB2058758.1 hypothetical protein [Clostridium perfringens]MDM0961627.1 hypothetical protein [Clostridium perfringens]